ncbi:hypothetical protein LZ32DRAFT_607586 [Colletotrichum eremochloae]|nr:hypothetical protein LZ32DRAFT_607586 [Colletotrichum eremochloae]
MPTMLFPINGKETPRARLHLGVSGTSVCMPRGVPWQFIKFIVVGLSERSLLAASHNCLDVTVQKGPEVIRVGNAVTVHDLRPEHTLPIPGQGTTNSRFLNICQWQTGPSSLWSAANTYSVLTVALPYTIDESRSGPGRPPCASGITIALGRGRPITSASHMY